MEILVNMLPFARNFFSRVHDSHVKIWFRIYIPNLACPEITDCCFPRFSRDENNLLSFLEFFFLVLKFELSSVPQNRQIGYAKWSNKQANKKNP